MNIEKQIEDIQNKINMLNSEKSGLLRSLIYIVEVSNDEEEIIIENEIINKTINLILDALETKIYNKIEILDNSIKNLTQEKKKLELLIIYN